MKTKTSKWFETKIQFDKTQKDRTQKKVTEQYVVEAISFTEAEAKIIAQTKDCVSGDYSVKNITPANYHEIFFGDDGKDEKWYKAKLQFITIDEKTEKEKRQNVCYLVQGSSTECAQKNIKEIMSGTVIDYVVVSIVETNIIDVFEHEAGKSNEAPKKGTGTIDEFE